MGVTGITELSYGCILERYTIILKIADIFDDFFRTPFAFKDLNSNLLYKISLAPISTATLFRYEI